MNRIDTLEAKFEALLRSPSMCPTEWGRDDQPDPSDDALWDAMFKRTTNLKSMSKSHGLEIIVFQP
jgi:hypothetical protein